MMSLDKRLKDLKIDPYLLKDATKLSGEDIEAIKQAFIDEGWRHPSSDQFLEMAEHFGYLKGPEWLATYNEAYKQVVEDAYGPEIEPVELPKWLIEKIARRVAGVDND
jgi:hypothetical protein